MPIHLLYLGFPEASKRLKARDEGTFLETWDQSSLKRLIRHITCCELPYRFCRGRGRSGSKPFIISSKMGRPRGIKESFFYGKPNQKKGKALLMMGGVEVPVVGDEWSS